MKLNYFTYGNQDSKVALKRAFSSTFVIPLSVESTSDENALLFIKKNKKESLIAIQHYKFNHYIKFKMNTQMKQISKFSNSKTSSYPPPPSPVTGKRSLVTGGGGGQ